MTPHAGCHGCQTCWASTIDLDAVEGPPSCGRWPECDPPDGTSECEWPNCPPETVEASPVLPPNGHAPARSPAPEGERTPETGREALRPSPWSDPYSPDWSWGGPA